MMKKYTALVIEDAPFYRKYVIDALRKSGFFKTIHGGATSQDCEQVLAKHSVDLLFLDLALDKSKQSGVDMSIKLKKERPNLKIIIVTSHMDISHIKPLLRIREGGGVEGILDKSELDDRNLKQVLSTVLVNKGKFFSQKVEKIKEDLIDGSRKADYKPKTIPKLTKTERKYLPYIVQSSNPEKVKTIMEKDSICVATGTIDTHRKKFYREFEVKDVGELYHKARQLGFID